MRFGVKGIYPDCFNSDFVGRSHFVLSKHFVLVCLRIALFCVHCRQLRLSAAASYTADQDFLYQASALSIAVLAAQLQFFVARMLFLVLMGFECDLVTMLCIMLG